MSFDKETVFKADRENIQKPVVLAWMCKLNSTYDWLFGKWALKFPLNNTEQSPFQSSLTDYVKV